VLVDGACYAYSMVTVPLYDTLGPDAVQYICSHAELAAVAVSAPLLPTLLPCLASVPTVKLVVRACAPGPALAACSRSSSQRVQSGIARGTSRRVILVEHSNADVEVCHYHCI